MSHDWQRNGCGKHAFWTCSICGEYLRETGKEPVRHQHISFIKSGIRLFGYVLLPVNIMLAATILVASEIVGILEEIGHE